MAPTSPRPTPRSLQKPFTRSFAPNFVHERGHPTDYRSQGWCERRSRKSDSRIVPVLAYKLLTARQALASALDMLDLL